MPQLLKVHSNRIIHGFTGLEDYRAFMREELRQLSEFNRQAYERYLGDEYVNRKLRDPQWYGADVTYEEITGHMTQFRDPELIEQVYNRVRNRLPENLRNRLQEKKLKFNPMYGVFSMDRFMMGMYRKPAFFNPVTKIFVSPAEIYENENRYFMRSDNTEVEKQLKLATHNKNVYAYFPHIDSDSNAIEIVIVAGANADKSSREMLYTGVTGIIIGELCERAGIKVRINIAIGSDNVVAIVPMKDFKNPIDRNVIALLSSDARVFRYEMFKGIICNYNHSNLNTPSGLGSLVTEQMIHDMFEDAMQTKKKVFSCDHIFYTSGIFDEQSVYRKIDQVLNEISPRT